MLSIPAPVATDELIARTALIVDSFARLLGRPLIDGSGDAFNALWTAPRVVVAHGTEVEPVFFYGNHMALQRFEMDFERFSQLPSRYSAEPLERAAREAFLQQVGRDGYIDSYSGVRISSSGKRFRIEQAIVWNLVDASGNIHGQAATFDRWQAL